MSRTFGSARIVTRERRRLAASVVVIFALGACVDASRARASGAASSAPERSPAVAGTFYPADRAQLARDIQDHLARAKAPGPDRPLALVAPHAGYVYCGRIIAQAWRQAAGRDYDLIVILGVNHRVPGLTGAVVWPDGTWRTPLGSAAVDAAAATALLAADAGFTADTVAHTGEHSLEVQVPFAQTVYPRLPILPVMVATEDPAVCARLGLALASALRGRRPLIVASSDLSHFPAAKDAAPIDRATLDAVAALDPAVLTRALDAARRRNVPGLATCACGEGPIRVALAAAKALGATRGVVLDYANSADAPGGDQRRVVGYGAVAFYAGAEPARPAPAERTGNAAPTGPGTLDATARRSLLSLARDTIRRHFAGEPAAPASACAPAARVARGVFVTLKESGDLRGCIGHLAEDLPLCEAVRQMALAAAFDDPRFAPLARDELARVTIEISALTPLRPVHGPGEIVVGRDGVVLRKAGRSAVFLPQVATEQGWDRDTLLAQLARKAGLPPEAWREGAELLTFQAEVFGEAGDR